MAQKRRILSIVKSTYIILLSTFTFRSNLKDMKGIIPVLLCLFLIGSCAQENKSTKNPSEQTIKKLEKEVMALHDEVMPFMNKMHKLEKSLRRQARSNPDSASIYKTAANDLHIADSLMWDWMYAYKNPKQLLDSLDDEKVIAYLKKEKIRAGKVNSSMKDGMSKASELLKGKEK
jgi:transcription-repair coupling factor (superfamily II helicase)